MLPDQVLKMELMAFESDVLQTVLCSPVAMLIDGNMGQNCYSNEF